MYSFTILKKAYNIPSTTRDLTLGQFIAISRLQPDDHWGLLTVLVGEVVSTAQNLKEIEQFKHEITSVFSLIEILTTDLQECLSSGILLVEPKKINILGLDIEIKPNFINQLPYWGYVHTRAAVIERANQDKEFNATDLIPGILAHNLYCLIVRSVYNESKAEALIEDVLNDVPFIEAMQLGNFFLLQHKKLWTSKRKRWIMNLTIWRLRLVYRISASLGRSTHWRRYREVMY